MAEKKVIKIIIALLTLTSAIAISYSNTLNYPFAFDDYLNIVNNHFIQIENLQTQEIITAASNGQSKHRWLPNISLALQYYFFGLNPYSYHVFNIGVHILCSIVLFFLIISILNYVDYSFASSQKHEIALFSAVLWSLHPVQTNAVTYIIQRMTSLSALFFMLSILLYARGRLPSRNRIRQYLLFFGSAISGLFSIASKENAVMLPLMIIGYEICIISPDRFLKNRRQILLSLGGACLFILVIGWAWLGGNMFDQILQGYHGRYFSLSERLLTEPRVIFFYISLIFLPLLSRLNINHDILISTGFLSPTNTALSICGLLLLLYSIHHLFTKDRVMSFVILWFLGNLLIESSIIALELCFEHRLYLPSSMLIFALIFILYNLHPRHLPLVRLGLIAITIIFGVLTWNRNTVWQSSVSLWSDSLSKSPGLIRAHVNLARSLEKEKKMSEAKEYLLKALTVDADRTIDHNLPAWKKEMSEVHSTLALIFRKQKKFPEARLHVTEALRLSPKSIDSLLTYGILLVEEGNYQPAYDIFTKLAVGGVDTVDLYNNWGICAYNLGEIDQAIFFFRRALKIDPNHAESHYNLGIAYGDKGMRDEARREMAWGMQL